MEHLVRGQNDWSWVERDIMSMLSGDTTAGYWVERDIIRLSVQQLGLGLRGTL